MTHFKTLPPELLALLTTKYISSKIDQLSFLVSSEDHWAAFCDHATSSEKWRFCSQFRLNPYEGLPDWSFLCQIYDGLKRLLLSKGWQGHTRYQYSLQRRRGYVDQSQLRPSALDKFKHLTWIRHGVYVKLTQCKQTAVIFQTYIHTTF